MSQIPSHGGLMIVHDRIRAAAKLRQGSRQLAQYNLRATTLDASSLDPAEPETLARFAGALDAACRLRSSIVIVSAGDDLGDPARSEQIMARLRHAAQQADTRGLTLALDTDPGLCSDTRGMQRTLEKIGQANVGLNFDLGRFVQQNPWSSVEVSLQRVYGQLTSVRLSNFAIGADPPEFPPLGQGGDVDFSRAWQILGGLKFVGPCTIAFRPHTRRPPTPQQCQEWLRQSINHLRGCGWFDSRL